MSARSPTRPERVVEAARQHIAIGPGANRKHLGDEPGPLQVIDDECRGAILVISDFGMGVDIAPDSNKALVQSTGEAYDLSASGCICVGFGHRVQSFTPKCCRSYGFPSRNTTVMLSAGIPPQTSRNASQTSPTVARSLSASLSGISALPVPRATASNSSSAAATAAWSRLARSSASLAACVTSTAGSTCSGSYGSSSSS